jgi:hypothetical protein
MAKWLKKLSIINVQAFAERQRNFWKYFLIHKYSANIKNI